VKRFLDIQKTTKIRKINESNYLDQSKEVNESKSKIKYELEHNNDYQMVSGIIDILNKVKDKENRMEIADDMISQFKREKIKFDYNSFLDCLK